ncbi:unnamed protein product [Oncorhynchus mykiss]|uniref:BED-type domain-containing protein n=1 Tax=Oncorhynchus mykiss TaxID=8022 RepID=A0A060WB00_ONCMY|nr:unnamed protein product [Oncorhynchus mykiss]
MVTCLLLFDQRLKMPQALSDVWIHFTAANVEGKAVYICEYCAKSYVKNVTKMQNHLTKCTKFPQRSQHATSDKIFYKSTDTRDNRQTGLYIADELKAVINDLGPQKVFGLVTDNAANMTAVWSKAEGSYPHITPIGCAAHSLNLLLKDIMALKTMDTLYKRAKEMVRFAAIT